MTAPHIDFSELRESTNERRRHAAQVIGHAARTSGFFYLTNTGISPEQIRCMLEASRTFFDQPEARKLELRWATKLGVLGYIPREREGLDERLPPDLKESFNVPPPVGNREPTDADRGWHASSDPLRDATDTFAALCFTLGQEIFSAIALSLDLPETFFIEGHRPDDQGMRLFHYFPAQDRSSERQLACGEHSDHGTLSLVFQDEAGGLEFRDSEGEWHSLPPVEGAVLVNAGDMMARWTGGVVRAAPHRVLSPERHRYSIGYFLIPRYEVVLSCPRTAVLAGTPETPQPFTVEEFLYLRSLRRTERYFRHHGLLAKGARPRGLVEMKANVAERLGIDVAALDQRLGEFGYIDTRDAVAMEA